MSVRKRTWTFNGQAAEAWVVDYRDAEGKRRSQQFERKRDADAFHATVAVDLRAGIHTAERASPTVVEAGRKWLQACEDAGLEQTTIDYYRQHLDLHIAPFIGAMRLAQLTVPMVRQFEDRLRNAGRSPVMTARAVGSLGRIIADAQENGRIRQNVVSELRGNRQRRRRGQDAKDRRQKGKLKVGVDIPSPAEIRQLIPALAGRWRPLILTALFTGLRASELRGLTWANLDLKRAEVHVRQRADRYNKIGPPKSADGERTVPIPPMLLKELRTWKLACPKGERGLVFPSGTGSIESLSNILQRGLAPAMLAAGLTKRGERKPKYSGLHNLRHFFASWCINRKADGGLELPPMTVKARMGHSSIQITFDRYGHLFPRGDDSAELAAAEGSLLG
jgi:integrase